MLLRLRLASGLKGEIPVETYRPVFYSIALLLCWWAMALEAYATLPDSMLRVVTMGIATVWFIYCGALLHRKRRYFSIMFYWSLALAPWAFYVELAFITDELHSMNAGDAEVRLKHAVVIYNCVRYLLLTLTLVIIIKDFFRQVRQLNR